MYEIYCVDEDGFWGPKRDEYGGIIEWETSKDIKSEHTLYSDRVDRKTHYKVAKEVFGEIGDYFSSRKPEDIERYISIVAGKEIELVRIVRYTHQANGYPIWRFDFKWKC